MAESSYSVSQLTRLVRQRLEQSFGDIWVTGEISNYHFHERSGIIYLTLKDATAQLSAIIYRNVAATLKTQLSNGLEVRLYGRLTVYEPQGRYQLMVKAVETSGQGELMAKFEALKRKLLAEKVFDRPRKPIPKLPRHIGIATSHSGAALRDILQVLGRRFPNLDILVRSTPVQGDLAADFIAGAIESLNRVGHDILPDYPPRQVIIVARGGGSLEDLAAFNEEIVARAIIASRIPVISGVGHETDTTICDLVADLRSPTPSAAAEQLIGSKTEFEEAIDNLDRRLRRMLEHRLTVIRGRLSLAGGNAVFSEPQHTVNILRQKLDSLEMRLQVALKTEIQERNRRCQHLQASLRTQRSAKWPELYRSLERYSDRMRMALRNREFAERSLKSLSARLDALDPRAVLRRGYSITRTHDGQVVRNAAEVPVGELLLTELADGMLTSRVETPHGGTGKTS